MKKGALKSMTPNLMVESVNETVEFYKKIGFQIIATVPEEGKLDWAMLQHGNVMLMLQNRNNMVAEYPSLNDQQRGGGLTLFIEVDDVSSIFSEIRETANVIKDLHITFYGMKEFAIEDCNNFILTFAERQA
jgi:uncharacterized glyoxalase superfamily protein PhnB